MLVTYRLTKFEKFMLITALVVVSFWVYMSFRDHGLGVLNRQYEIHTQERENLLEELSEGIKGG